MRESLPRYTSSLASDVWTKAPLQKIKGIPSAEQCPSGTRVCGIKRDIRNETSDIYDYFVVAGDFGGKDNSLDAKRTRLKTSTSHGDEDKEGVRVELHGGVHPWQKVDGVDQVKQTASIEFLCEKDLDGDEGNEKQPEVDSSSAKRAEKDEKNVQALSFVGYKDGTLTLSWKTKYACEDAATGRPPSTGGWGFFTWMIIM